MAPELAEDARKKAKRSQAHTRLHQSCLRQRVEAVAESGSQPVNSGEDWWAMIMGSGYRGTVAQLDPADQERLRLANLEFITRTSLRSLESKRRLCHRKEDLICFSRSGATAQSPAAFLSFLCAAAPLREKSSKTRNLFTLRVHPRHGQFQPSPACKSIRVLLNLVNGMPPRWEKYHEENISTSALHFAAGFDLHASARRHHSSQRR
jgi:hypothetical protein